MPSKVGGLGRGLDSLFADTGSGAVPGQAQDVATLSLREIEPDPEQPRREFEPGALADLAKSIKEHGVLQPILVRPAGIGSYIIVAGERRWRAARQAGLTEIPVIVREVSDEQAMEIALIENLQREDLDPIEEALGYKQLMERCNLTQEQTAERLARSRSAVANSLRLLALPQEVLELLKKGQLTAGHAKAILSLPLPSMQRELAERVVKEKLNVRKAEALARQMQKSPKTQKKKSPRPSFVAEAEISLREVLGSEVRIQYDDGEGVLQLPFYSQQQLQELANCIGAYFEEWEPEAES